jgi:porphobilinogen synthase
MKSHSIDTQATADRGMRLRRLRGSSTVRAMLRETSLEARHLIHPIFVAESLAEPRAIASMPGHSQLPIKRVAGEAGEAAALGIGSVLLFGIPGGKNASGSGAWSANGPVPEAIRAITASMPDVVVIADVCMCEYTSHGHCGVLDARHQVDNDATLESLARAAVAYADAGAHVVAPSAMMDHQVAAIRSALDEAGHSSVAILAYSTKFASAFYGPFRDAAESAPAFGDRRSYQLDPANIREAVRESLQDEDEGADMLMVKPAGPYLDVVRAVRDASALPLVAYQVSGEYAMLKAAAERGWLDERRCALESLVGIRRAGADLIVSYYAKEAARWLGDSGE